MKKMISMLLLLAMLLASAPVFATKEDSGKMQEVLLLVKDKISVPEELSEFSGNVSDYNGKISYYFDWTTPDYEKSMTVSSDDKGRITSYRKNTFESSDKRLSGVSKSELIDFAEKFLRTTVPEAFISDTDSLVYDESGYYASGNLMYSLVFRRQKDGIEVKDNYANVRLCVVEDAIQVRSMDINFAYDGEFDEHRPEVEDSKAKYMELFPVELIYRDEYNPLAKGKEARFSPILVYRIKDDNAGYMDSASGEILTEDAYDENYKNAPEAEDSMVGMGTSSGGSSLTTQEIAELEKVEGLKNHKEIEQTVKELPYLDFSDELELRSSNLYKDSLGKYYYRMNYSYETENTYRYFNIRANAETGELIELSNHSGNYEKDEPLTEEEKKAAEPKIREFLNAVAKEKFFETEKDDVTEYGSTYSEYFVRMVSGVPYIDNGIRISFDAKNNAVRNYSLQFTEGEFANPAEAIGGVAAYESILEYAPIIPLYVKSGGLYKKAFTLSKRSVAVDAGSGEIRNKETEKAYQYTDIEGHWVEEAATKLLEIQVGLTGGRLEPEVIITQEEFLRLLASAVIGQFYQDYSLEELYENLIRGNTIREEEKAPESEVLREDAFVYVIRMAGLEKVAELSDIYKVSYEDEGDLSEGKLGYAAILSGLGVVSGDGGKLRPQDAMTRAEAIAIVYRYLLSL